MKNLLIIAALSMILFGCEKQNRVHEVKLSVLNTKDTCLVQFNDENGIKRSDSTNGLKWYRILEVEPETFIFVKAESRQRDNSMILKVYLDGKLVKESTNNGGDNSAQLYFYLTND